MKKQIFLSNKERKELEPAIEREKSGMILMEHGARLLNDGRGELWAIIKRNWPKAKKLDHPKKGKWSIFIDDEVEEVRD